MSLVMQEPGRNKRNKREEKYVFEVTPVHPWSNPLVTAISCAQQLLNQKAYMLFDLLKIPLLQLRMLIIYIRSDEEVVIYLRLSRTTKAILTSSFPRKHHPFKNGSVFAFLL